MPTTTAATREGIEIRQRLDAAAQAIRAKDMTN